MSLANKVRYLLRGLQPGCRASAAAAPRAARAEAAAARGAAYEALRTSP